MQQQRVRGGLIGGVRSLCRGGDFELARKGCEAGSGQGLWLIGTNKALGIITPRTTLSPASLSSLSCRRCRCPCRCMPSARDQLLLQQITHATTASPTSTSYPHARAQSAVGSWQQSCAWPNSPYRVFAIRACNPISRACIPPALHPHRSPIHPLPASTRAWLEDPGHRRRISSPSAAISPSSRHQPSITIGGASHAQSLRQHGPRRQHGAW